MEVEVPQTAPRVALVRASTHSLELCWVSVPTAQYYLLEVQPIETPVPTSAVASSQAQQQSVNTQPQPVVSQPQTTPHLSKLYALPSASNITTGMATANIDSTITPPSNVTGNLQSFTIINKSHVPTSTTNTTPNRNIIIKPKQVQKTITTKPVTPDVPITRSIISSSITTTVSSGQSLVTSFKTVPANISFVCICILFFAKKLIN